MDLRAGQVIGAYELVEKAGAGGFSVVWLARRPGEPEVRFALKLPLVPEFTDHLRHEAVLRSRVKDENVVEVLEAHLDHDPPYLVMPRVHGRTLPLPSEPAPPDRIVDALEAVFAAARVVARLHASDVVHGDLKPGNLMVGPAGAVHVLDLGLARVQLRTRRDRSLAQSLVSVDGRAIGGTLEFMAPEVLTGSDPTPAADVYALGVILHWKLAGRPPAFGVSPGRLNPYLPPGTDDLLRRMLHHDPAVRAPDAGSVLLDLARLVADERRCLARKNGHERRRVFQARMDTLRKGFRAMLTVLVLPTLIVGLTVAGSALPNGPLIQDPVGVAGTAIVGIFAGVYFGFVALLLGLTTINAWVMGVPERTYKNRTGHPIWSFMMQ